MRVAFICDVILEDEGWATVKKPAIQLGMYAHSPFPVRLTAPAKNGPALYTGVAEMTQEQITATLGAVQAGAKRIMFFTEQSDLTQPLDAAARLTLNAMLVSVGIEEAGVNERVDAIMNRIMNAQERTHDVESRLERLNDHPDEIARLEGRLQTTPIIKNP